MIATDEKTILLVEDDPNDEALTLRAFKKNNITNKVVVARDGSEALDYLFCIGNFSGRDPKDLPQLILLDLKLPKLNGHEVLEKIRSDNRTQLLPVVILTTSKEDLDIVRSYQLGANSFIQKPVDFTKFTQVVGQLGLYWLVYNEMPKSTEG